MHPSITGVAANEYPTIDEMSEYTNTHANRYDSKGEVDHLNETIRGKDFEMEQQLQQLMDELDDDSDDDTDDDSDDDCTKGTTKKDTARKMEATAMVSKKKKKKKKKKKHTPSPLGKRTMFQRGLGLFIRFEISKDSIRCNDENFMRWGECFFTRFFKFLCLGEAGWPENRFDMEFGIAYEGFQTMQKYLKETMADFVKNRPTPDEKWCCPPAHDPRTVCPPAPDWNSDIAGETYSTATQMSQP